MCGIIGFIGGEQAAPILLGGLKKLEYRGYDSAGIAILEDGRINIAKSKGRLETLSDKIEGGRSFFGTVGIGHTRWATHGEPSDANSHPHRSSSGKFAIVHNGIIENYAVLKAQLQAQGCTFASETDTEVIAHLLEQNDTGDFLETIRLTVAQLEGSYALGILNEECPDEIACVRCASPLIVALSDGGNFIASDITAVLPYTRRIYQLDDGEIALLHRDHVSVYDEQGHRIKKELKTITWSVASAEKGGYEHFMMKEIMEQPQAISATVSPRIGNDGRIILDGISLTREELRAFARIFILACGSAYHVGVVGKYVIEQAARIPVEVDIASEFRYRMPLVDARSLVLIISQSGETADTLAALSEAKSHGARVISIVNVVGSTIARESDDVLYTWAGPEISVATTKAYSTQLTLVYLLALYIADALGRIDTLALRHALNELIALPEKIQQVLDQAPAIEQFAQRLCYLDHAYFIGRNLDYAVALEASLKLKEISYIHSEAYAAGELKHGTISLIEPGTFVAALACCERLFDKTVSNIREVKARGAQVLCVTQKGNEAAAGPADHVFFVPRTNPLFMPSIEVVPMQLLGYYAAKARGCDIDKPRNLAKSVTVE